jgi:hypothetical protein
MLAMIYIKNIIFFTKERRKINYSQEFLDLLKSVNKQRPKTVIKHLLKHGSITTEVLRNKYGYVHPPRAIRDVKEHGIPLKREWVKNKDGKRIACYKFEEFNPKMIHKISGRTTLSKKIKKELIARYGAKCFIYNELMDEKYLQIDHRVPLDVDGDFAKNKESKYYMLLSPSANKLKSWFCENCNNWKNKKNKKICLSCYWAYPEKYSHIAMTQIRRLDIIWQGDEILFYETLKKQAKKENNEIQYIVKCILEKYI